MGDAGHGLGVLGTHPSEVGRNFIEDDGGFAFAEFGFKPSGGGLVVLGKITVGAKNDHVSSNRTSAIGIGEWYPMISVRLMEKPTCRAATNSAAAFEILDTSLPLDGGEINWQTKLASAPALLCRLVYFWLFSPPTLVHLGYLLRILLDPFLIGFFNFFGIVTRPFTDANCMTRLTPRAKAVFAGVSAHEELRSGWIGFTTPTTCLCGHEWARRRFPLVGEFPPALTPTLLAVRGQPTEIVGYDRCPVEVIGGCRLVFFALTASSVAVWNSGWLCYALTLLADVLYSQWSLVVFSKELASGWKQLLALIATLEDIRHDCPSIGLFHTISERGGMERTPCHRFMTPIKLTAIIP